MERKGDHHRQPQLAKSEIIKEMPAICSNELAAVEFLEARRWGETPCCVHCGSVNVFQFKDEKTGERNKRFLWKCRDCRKQYTVRIGTVYEESRIPLRCWCFAFWAMSSSKKGVSALQIMRQCQISYKSALFLLHRIRHAMAPAADAPKLNGIVEADETYVGGKPRFGNNEARGTGTRPTVHRGRGTKKTPVFAIVERGGRVRARVIASVTAKTLKSAIRESVDEAAIVNTDGLPSYNGLRLEFAAHWVVQHHAGEYSRGRAHTNTIESFFAIVKRGINGVYHAVSKAHLHRYLSEFEFRYNGRSLNDGERVMLAIQSAEGKRLMYRASVAKPAPEKDDWRDSLFD